MRAAILFIGVLLLFSGCISASNSRLLDSYEKARVEDIVELHIKRIPTYQVGGTTLRQSSMFNINCVVGNQNEDVNSNSCWDASYTFISAYDGYGYRDNLKATETNHTIKIKLKDDIVIYSVIDNRWDTLSQSDI